MPVDQTGESILFEIDNGYVEAHVQIEYDGGDADQFAWLVPVPEVPEIEVGSWRLVSAALQATRPIHGFQDQQQCEDTNGGPPSTGGVGFLEDPDGGGGSSPEVVAEDVVGAFQYAILQGGTAQTVTDWLVANDYAVEDEAPDILDEYITEGHVFVAAGVERPGVLQRRRRDGHRQRRLRRRDPHRRGSRHPRVRPGRARLSGGRGLPDRRRGQCLLLPARGRDLGRRAVLRPGGVRAQCSLCLWLGAWLWQGTWRRLLC